jgi:Tol biopolymer transport system component
VTSNRHAGAAVAAVAAVAVAAATAANATFSGANGRLLYQQLVGGHEQLFSIRPDGTGAQQLTTLTDSDAINASWSPDGSKIAFVRYWKDPERWRIATVNADGSDLRTFERRYRLAVAWFPDGKHLLVLRNLRWTIITVSGGSPRDAGIPGWGDAPCVFPDGKRVAFTTGRPNGDTAIVVGRVGGGPGSIKRITPWQSMADKIDCSPDGSKIVFSAPRFGYRSSNVYVVGADGTGLRRLTDSDGRGINNGANSWSPDGRKISFVSNRQRDGIFRIYTMNGDGTGVTIVTRGREARRSSWGTHP